jgi:hypothetical protein
MTQKKTLKIEEVRLDGGTQARAELNLPVVAEYAEAIARGEQFPPIALE